MSARTDTGQRPIDRVLSALEARGFKTALRPTPKHGMSESWSCQCPAHDDKNPSFDVDAKQDGTVLMKCQSVGCSNEEIRAALGLEWSDLFPGPGRKGSPRRWSTEELAAKSTPPFPMLYTDENGAPLILVTRFDPPGKKKEFAQFRPDGRGGWFIRLEANSRKPLFRLPTVIRAVAAGETVIVVEGEKCVAAVESLGFVATTNSEGKGKWLPEHTETLRAAARVVVMPDNDEGGRKHMYHVGDDLLRAGTRDVRIIELPGRAKFDVADWLAERPDLETAKAEFAKLLEEAEPYVSAILPEKDDGRPSIRITAELHEMGDAAVRAIADRPDCGIFVRGGRLVRVVRESSGGLVGLTRPPEAPSIRAVEPETLREILSAIARWEKWDGRSDEFRPAVPPFEVTKAILARGEWPGLRHLEGIVESPVILPDGTILDVPGHHEATGLLYVPTARAIPTIEIPSDPLATAVAAAADLMKPFMTFRFADPDAAYPALLAAILTPIARHLIPGPVPMFAVPAPTARSGKGKLCASVGIIALGREPSAFSGWKPREEYDKLFSAIAQEGDRVIVLDNVVGTLRSPELAYAITTGTYRSREFGQNRRTLRAPWIATVFVNGNNLRLASDLSYRAIPIAIDWQTERPDLLQFPYDIVRKVRDERPALHAAAQAVLRAHILAGRPSPGKRWCDFEEWDAVVRQCCIWVGVGDPLGGRETLIAEADDDLALAREVFDAWRNAFDDEPATVAEAIRRAEGKKDDEGDSVLRAALTQVDYRSDGKKLNPRLIGAFMKGLKNKIVGGMKLIEDGESHSAKLWKVMRVGPSGGPTVAEGGAA